MCHLAWLYTMLYCIVRNWFVLDYPIIYLYCIDYTDSSDNTDQSSCDHDCHTNSDSIYDSADSSESTMGIETDLSSNSDNNYTQYTIVWSLLIVGGPKFNSFLNFINNDKKVLLQLKYCRKT